MKWITIVVLFIVTLVGCTKEPLPDPNPVAKKVRITAYAGNNGVIDPSGVTEVALGSSKVYTIRPNNGYSIKTVKINGVDQTLPLPDNTLKLESVLENKDIDVSFVSNDFVSITNPSPWFLKSAGNYLDNDLEIGFVIDETQLTDQYFFYPDGTTYAYHKGQNESFAGCYWSYSEQNRSIKIGSITYQILECSEKILSFQVKVFTEPSGKIRYIRQNYWRP